MFNKKLKEDVEKLKAEIFPVKKEDSDCFFSIFSSFMYTTPQALADKVKRMDEELVQLREYLGVYKYKISEKTVLKKFKKNK